MAYNDPGPNIDETVTCFVPLAGTPAGGIFAYVPVPWRGRLIEAGYLPNSGVTSTMTIAVAVRNNSTPTASNFVNVISSALGSFSSANTVDGAVCSVVPASPVPVTHGDTVQFTFSGGQSSTVTATAYAIIRRG